MIRKMLLMAFIAISFYANSQEATQKRTVLDEQSVVRGEDGMVYPYTVWKKLMQTGKYGLKNRKTVTESGQPEYLIYELPADQKAAYFDKMAKPRSSESFVEGNDFKGFKVTDMNGNKFDLRESKGKVLVLNFWFINCPPCKKEIPQLNELVTEYKDNPNVVFLAIATDEKYDLKTFLKTNPFNYNIVDGGRYISDKYRVKLYPTHVVIDKAGKIKFGTVGLASNTIHWIKKSINESLATN